MAIGLEIEVPVPIDQLTAAEVAEVATNLKLAKSDDLSMGPSPSEAAAHGILMRRGKVPYGIIRPSRDGFRIDGDHDDRVRGPEQFREGGLDSIMEIVMDPPAVNQAGLRTAMANIGLFVDAVEAKTKSLSRRWVDALPGIGGRPVSIGPLDWEPKLPKRQKTYGWDGSLQVNIGIDLREYHNLLRWYASMPYSQPPAGPEDAKVMFQRIRDDIALALEVSGKLVDPLLAMLSSAQRAEAGNGCGLRGFLTHLALYLRRSVATGVAGNSKNAVPVLAKSPNLIMSQYGMTAREKAVYNANKDNLMAALLSETGRTEHLSPGFDPALVTAFPRIPGSPTMLADLFDLTCDKVPLAGTPRPEPTGVGRLRTGNDHVRGLPQVGAGDVGGGVDTRGGMIMEFRAFTSFYTGPLAWLEVGTAFLAKATELNNRNGLGTL